MASMAQRRAAKRNIKKAQAALRAKHRGGSRKSSKSRKTRRSHSHAHKAFTRRQNKSMFPEAGKWMRAYRVLDILTTSVQTGIRHFGGNLKEVFLQARRTALGIAPDGSFQLADALPHAEAVAVGLIRDKIRSKLGVYRGMAKGKVLSFLIAASPEIVALGYADPMTDPWGWKTQAVLADRAYNMDVGTFAPDYEGFKQSITMDLVLWGGQKLIEKTGVNRELSKLTDGLVKA